MPDHRIRLLYMQFAPGGTLAEVVKQVRETPQATRTGTMLVARTGDDLAELHRLTRWQARLGLAVTPARASELREREPRLAPGIRAGSA